MFSFDELVMKYGPGVAQQCLTEIEKAARISSSAVYGLDPEIRLLSALNAQDAACSMVA